MSLAVIVFYVFAALTILSGLFILFTKNVLYAGFALLCTFIGVAAIYVFAGADFLAVTQLMIYVGGVLVLILFGILLTNREAGQSFIYSGSRNVWIGIVGSVIFLGILIMTIVKAKFGQMNWIQSAIHSSSGSSTIERIGENLMTEYVLPFEIAGVLLLIALIGAAFIVNQVQKK